MPALALLSQRDTYLSYLYVLTQSKSQGHKVQQGIIFSHEDAPQGQKLEYLVKIIVFYHANELCFLHVIFLP